VTGPRDAPGLLAGAFLFSALVSYLATPIVARVALAVGAIDRPGGRRVHAGTVPRLGGLAVLMGLLAGPVVWGLARGPDAVVGLAAHDGLQAFLLPMLAVFLVGVVDDVRGLGAAPRVVAEAAAASVLIQAGYVIDDVTLPYLGPLSLGLLAYPLTLLWFVGVTNAFNLIDGLDGLLGSVALTALLGCAAVAVLGDRLGSATLALALAGSIAGFLRWNWHPARIFLGDSGSLLIGFTVAALSLKVARNPAGDTLSAHVPVLLCLLPICETLLTLARRHVSGQAYFAGDRSHIHHVLVNRGLSVPRAVATLAGTSALFAVAAGLSRSWRNEGVLLLIGVTLLAAFLGLRWLGYVELRVLVARLRGGLPRRGRSAISGEVALARAGEAFAGARTLDDLRARLEASARTMDGLAFLAVELDAAGEPPLTSWSSGAHPLAAAYLAALPPGRVAWVVAGVAPWDPATSSTWRRVEPLPAGERRGRLVLERCGDADARLGEYLVAPLADALAEVLHPRAAAPSATNSGAPREGP
jgi:UDP-GlcNAc:undecaprenyl-phosphate GlcNAc-1-phosphate transferase